MVRMGTGSSRDSNKEGAEVKLESRLELVGV